MKVVLDRHGDVQRLRMVSVAGKLVQVDVSAYVLRGVMIDCGFPRAQRAIVDAVASLGVDGVIVTHWHEDHAGNAGLLASRGVPISMRADSEATLRDQPDIALYRRLVWGQPLALRTQLAPFVAPGFEGVHTPGHSSDHQSVWDAETGTLFSGDLWLGVRARVMHRVEDPYVMIPSLRAAAALNPERMFDAHRGLVSRPGEALRARADWLETTIAEIERRVAEGWSDRAIVLRVLGGEERAAYVSRGEYSRRNFVRAVRRQVSG